MSDLPSKLDDDLLSEITDLADQLGESDRDADAARRLEFVVDLLIKRGHLAPGHRRLVGKIKDSRSPVRLAMFRDKHSLPSPDVDCASLIPLCKGRCCTFTLSLSAEDVRERKLEWDLLEPYMMAKKPTGYCTYHHDKTGCTVYDDRPGTCRSYDCREDRRVWLDYDARIPAPMPDEVVPISVEE